MKKKFLLLRISFILLLLLAAMHTFFIIIGGPTFPDTQEFNQMREFMRTIQIDSGGGIVRTMQNFMDGFNIIASIFLITFPIFSLLAIFAFTLTSFSYLAIGGTIVGGIICLLLTSSLFIRK